MKQLGAHKYEHYRFIIIQEENKIMGVVEECDEIFFVTSYQISIDSSKSK